MTPEAPLALAGWAEVIALAGVASVVTMGVVAAIKKGCPKLAGGLTVAMAAVISVVVALVVQAAMSPTPGPEGMYRAFLIALVAWPASLGVSSLVRMPQRTNGG
jgi:hypothetical protein